MSPATRYLAYCRQADQGAGPATAWRLSAPGAFASPITTPAAHADMEAEARLYADMCDAQRVPDAWERFTDRAMGFALCVLLRMVAVVLLIQLGKWVARS